MRKPRQEMIAETRGKLIAAGRRAFGTIGYAEASMDDFTGEAGLTRGALYHHFGDKRGLLQAVIMEIDAEMTERLNEVSAASPTRWQGFVDECSAYIEMALEPEIQRIMFRDGPAVLGDISQWQNTPAVSLLFLAASTVSRPMARSSTSTPKPPLASSMAPAAIWRFGSPMPRIRRRFRSGRSRDSKLCWEASAGRNRCLTSYSGAVGPGRSLTIAFPPLCSHHSTL